MNIILTFFYIFGFSFRNGTGIDSCMVVAIYLLLYAAISKKYRNSILIFLKKQYVKYILFSYCLINCIAFISMFANSSFDISFCVTFFGMFYRIFIGIFLYLYFVQKKCEEKIINYIVLAFTIQTCIQWAAFISPEIKHIIDMTKSASTIEIGVNYGGTRANALAGSNFFGLSAAYAVFFILFLSPKNTLFQYNRIIKLGIYVFNITGTFFAGRTGYIGLGIAVLFLIIKNIVDHRKKRIRIKEYISAILLVFVLLGFSNYLITQFNQNDQFNLLFNFTFESLFNMQKSGSFMVSSLDALNDMYFKIPIKTFLLGDGQYTMPSGSYYMNTDVGYMRVILFMGIFGLAMMIFMQLLLLKPWRGQEKFLKWTIFVALLVLNLKGEVIVWSQHILCIVVLYALFDLFENNKLENHQIT